MSTVGRGHWDGSEIRAGSCHPGRGRRDSCWVCAEWEEGPGARVLGSVSHLLFILERRGGVGGERIVPFLDRQY